jgi:DNA-binding ferritin-like protein
LAGVFDPARVEEILNALLSTIDQQNERIIALEGHHASSTSAPVTVSSLHAQLQQSTADNQKVLMSIDARLQSVEKQCRMLTELAPKWNNAAQEQLQLASQAQLHAATAQFEATQQRMWEEFQVIFFLIRCTIQHNLLLDSKILLNIPGDAS